MWGSSRLFLSVVPVSPVAADAVGGVPRAGNATASRIHRHVWWQWSWRDCAPGRGAEQWALRGHAQRPRPQGLYPVGTCGAEFGDFLRKQYEDMAELFARPTSKRSEYRGQAPHKRSPVWVKLRRTQCEQMWSALRPKADFGDRLVMSLMCHIRTFATGSGNSHRHDARCRGPDSRRSISGSGVTVATQSHRQSHQPDAFEDRVEGDHEDQGERARLGLHDEDQPEDDRERAAQ